MDAGLIVGVALAILLFILGVRSARRHREFVDRELMTIRELMLRMCNLLAHGAHHVQALAGKLTFRDSLSAKVIRKDGTTEDLGELKPPQ